MTGSDCGRPHCALVEFGFPFLKKGGCLVALGLGLGDVLGSRAGLDVGFQEVVHSV